jgi:16S rRNA (cytidine1402-2'-O)-methyltransferase
MPGSLYIVSTPIGNLKDITLRAIETLKLSDFIVCEDTRVASFLLNSIEAKKELVSVNAVNEREGKKIDKVIERILEGENCSLISDAGTPGISDPGVRLISGAIKNKITVISIPGPSALTAALSISGLPSDSFVFEGFLPIKKGRQKLLKELSEEKRTIVLYESTYRIEKLINELNTFMPERFIVICREITKKFEETWKGFPKEILSSFNERITKGEFVVVISPKDWKVY